VLNFSQYIFLEEARTKYLLDKAKNPQGKFLVGLFTKYYLM